ncbi:hypothetical protein I4F81_005040 [Pyropia yezoensis]|uniref:Uncharacterized protein n=1 Tax=Pyropia yezoensis TaxID=2788 RepID=A0ACC3BX48_PYRYE|nr:hypothetical protein I4F81_005040 [Neopyropia yezoensis]
MNPPPLPEAAPGREAPGHPTPPPAKRRALPVSPTPPEGGTAGDTPGEAALWAELSRMHATAAALAEETEAIRTERSVLSAELSAAREEREQFRAIAGQVKALEGTVGMQASRIEWLISMVERLRAGASDDGGAGYDHDDDPEGGLEGEDEPGYEDDVEPGYEDDVEPGYEQGEEAGDEHEKQIVRCTKKMADTARGLA